MATDLSLEAAQETDTVRRAFDDELAGVAGVRNAADARLVDLVVRALAEGLWRGHRVHTPVQWLMWRAGVSRTVARRVVALARRAPVLPVTMAMFTGGAVVVRSGRHRGEVHPGGVRGVGG